MAKYRPNPRLAKMHRNYSVDEIARLYGIHRNTVRAWLKRGLPPVDDRRPLLVLGRHLSEFLEARREVKKRPSGPGLIYCLRCREPRRPAGGVVRYEPLTPNLGNLVGACSTCGAGLYRRVNRARMEAALGDLQVMTAVGLEHIDESPKPTPNRDFTH
jgi:hypothetical protein